MKEKNRYRISVILPNSKQLIFNVEEYEIVQGTMIKFYDSYKKKTKMFDSRIVEIEIEGAENVKQY